MFRRVATRTGWLGNGPSDGLREALAILSDRYEPVDLFALVPQLGLELEPQLAQLERLLDDDRIFRRVRDDLDRRYPLTRLHVRRSDDSGRS